MTKLENPHVLARKCAKIDANVATPKHNAVRARGLQIEAPPHDLKKWEIAYLCHLRVVKCLRGILLGQVELW